MAFAIATNFDSWLKVSTYTISIHCHKDSCGNMLFEITKNLKFWDMAPVLQIQSHNYGLLAIGKRLLTAQQNFSLELTLLPSTILIHVQ